MQQLQLYDRNTLPERFSKKIDFTDTCWLWKAAKTPRGYGKYSGGYAHRYSWTIFNGEIPVGYFVLHKCDVPSCVNPSHLFVGTHQDNMDDMNAKGRRGVRGDACLKLTKSDAKEIRSFFIQGSMRKYVRNEFSISALARKYGVSVTPIRNILSNKTFKDLQEEENK